MNDATSVHRRVRLLRVPTALLDDHRRHLEDLVHELHIVVAGAESGAVEGGGGPAPIVSEMLDAYSRSGDFVSRQAEAAASRGNGVVDIDIEVHPSVATGAPRLVELLEEVDRMCRDRELLTVAAPPEVAELRRWMCAQIVAQVERGEEPEPFRH